MAVEEEEETAFAVLVKEEEMAFASAVEEETAYSVACLEVWFCWGSGKGRCGRTLCVCLRRTTSRRPGQAMVDSVSLELTLDPLTMKLELSLTSWKA